MTCNVVYGDKRLSARHGKSLCKADTYKQSADKSGCISNGDTVKVCKCDICIVKSLADNTEYIFTMTA